MKRRNALYGSLVLIISLMLIFAGACTQPATVKDGSAEQQQVAQKESAAGVQKVSPESQPVTGETKAAAEAKPEKGKIDTYVVKKGDCLWSIAKKKNVYNDPFLWPVIYEANKDIIKNPGLLYPGQKLNIPRGGYGLDEIKGMRKKAGAPKPYSPTKQAKLPVN